MARDLGCGLVGGYNSDALQNEVRLTSIVGGGNLFCPIVEKFRRPNTVLEEPPEALRERFSPRSPKGVHEKGADANRLPR
jgi:hypothetical protein